MRFFVCDYNFIICYISDTTIPCCVSDGQTDAPIRSEWSRRSPEVIDGEVREARRIFEHRDIVQTESTSEWCGQVLITYIMLVKLIILVVTMCKWTINEHVFESVQPKCLSIYALSIILIWICLLLLFYSTEHLTLWLMSRLIHINILCITSWIKKFKELFCSVKYIRIYGIPLVSF